MARQSRFRTGLELAKISWRTLRDHKALMAFPVMGIVLALIIGLLLTLPGILLITLTDVLWAAIILFAISGYLLAFTGVFVGVGLCATVDKVLRGEDARFADGIHVARERIPEIAKWALMVATVRKRDCRAIRGVFLSDAETVPTGAGTGGVGVLDHEPTLHE